MKRFSDKSLESGFRAGFTLVEVMVALVVFGIVVATSMAISGSAAVMQEEAVRRDDATMIAQQVVSRLKALSITTAAECNVATSLISDLNAGNNLKCVGVDESILACNPDHPQNAAELNLVMSSVVGVDAIDWVLGVNEAGFAFGGAGMDVISYRGQSFRVTWNVDCNVPLSNLATVVVNVTWGPIATVFTEKRHVNVEVVIISI